jgi:tetratricopeptide (TPR) repeat protein
MQTQIVVRLKELLKSETEIRIISGETIQPLKSHDLARNAGLEVGADIVLWGISRLMEGNVDVESYITISDHKIIIQLQYKDIIVYDLSYDNGFKLLAKNSEEIVNKCLFMTAQIFNYYGYGKRALSVNQKIVQRTYNVLVQEADLFSVLKNPVAEEMLQSTIQAQPEKVRAYVSLGYFYLSRGKYRQSINILNKAILLDSNGAWRFLCLGNAHFYLGQYNDALANFQKALEINPKHYNSLSRMSALYYELGQYNKAIPFMERAIKLSSPKALKQLLYRLANIYLEKGDYDAAIKYYKQTIKVSPKETWAHHSLGLAFAHNGKYKKAQKELEIEISNYPTREVHYNGLGSVCLAQGNNEKAVESFAHAIDLNSKNLHSHLLYHLALVKFGKKDSAKTHLDSLAQFTKGDKWIAPMLDFYSGEIKVDSVLAATGALKPIHETRNRCEAYYYIGMAYLLNIVPTAFGEHSNEQIAKDYFQKCVDTGIRDYWEYVLAQAELNRLNGDRSITARLKNLLKVNL